MGPWAKIGLSGAGENRWEWTIGRKWVQVGPTAKIGGSVSEVKNGFEWMGRQKWVGVDPRTRIAENGSADENRLE